MIEIENIFAAEIGAKNIVANPSFEELRRMAGDGETTAANGSSCYNTEIKSRSAKFTEVIYGSPTEKQANLISEVRDYLKETSVIYIDKTMCLNPAHRLSCRLYITERYARLPFMWGQTLFDPIHSGKPDMTVVDVPEWGQRKVLVCPRYHTTYILGTDYMGEIKKAFLRMTMYVAKKRGGLGLHAGSKMIRIHDVEGRIVEKGALFFGLSATGKTTLTCHHHFLEGKEGVTIRQDDVVLLQRNGFCYGTEDNFYIKTEGLEPEGQPVLYNATMSPRAMFENVHVDEKGMVDFFNDSETSNGRAVVFRRDMDYTDDRIDLPKVHMIFFITRRNDIAPPIAKLTCAQAAAFFILGESVESSAGDPSRAGKSIRVVGTNPFIIGSPEEEGNIFYDFLKANPQLECFVMNTGRVGGKEPEGIKITIQDSQEMIRQAARNAILWKKDPDWGYLVPEYIPNVDLKALDPRSHYSRKEYRELILRLKEERRTWMKKFPGLREEIVGAISL